MTHRTPSSTKPNQPTPPALEVAAPAATVRPTLPPPSALAPSAHMMKERWNELPEIRMNNWRLAGHRIVAATRAHDTHLEIDFLRTKLMAMIRENGWSTLGITSPRGGSGKTTLALNLAFSFAWQANFKVGLLDLDLRRPKISKVLHCEQSYDIEGFLRGYRSMPQSLVRHRNNLVIATNAVPVPEAAELLMECVPGKAISQMREMLGLDLLLYDLSPMLASDDALAVLPGVDAMLLVAAAGETTMSELDICERELSRPGKLAGIVLNKCGFLPERFGY
jgi:protein-tyrosine kinase